MRLNLALSFARIKRRMKFKNEKRTSLAANRIGKKSSINQVPFFEEETNNQREVNYDDEDIESVESEDEEDRFYGNDDEEEGKVGEEMEDEFAHETPGEKRKRLAKEMLNQIREAKRRERKEDDEEDGVRPSILHIIIWVLLFEIFLWRRLYCISNAGAA